MHSLEGIVLINARATLREAADLRDARPLTLVEAANVADAARTVLHSTDGQPSKAYRHGWKRASRERFWARRAR
jgi:hypothetical protein